MKIWIFGLMALLSVSANAETDKQSNLSVNFMDLALWAKNSSQGDFFNSANITIQSNLVFKDADINIPGKINISYSLFGLENDSKLNTSQNWMGGVGSYIPGAIAMNDITHHQLSNVTWDSTWADNRLYTSIGRVSPRRYFYYNICSLAALCVDPVKSATGSPPLPYGYWGGYFKYMLTDNLYFHAGAFEVNTTDVPNGKSGYDFSFHHNAGENYIYSLGYLFDENRGKTELTYSDNNAQYKNAYTGKAYDGVKTYNIRFNYKFDAEKKYEFSGIYSYINQKNWVYKSYWELGLNCKDCFFDQKIGLRVGQSLLNHDYYAYTQSLNGNKNKRTTFTSVDTEFAITKRLSISPFMQFVWNPDNFYKGQGSSFEHNLIIGALLKAKIY